MEVHRGFYRDLSPCETPCPSLPATRFGRKVKGRIPDLYGESGLGFSEWPREDEE